MGRHAWDSPSGENVKDITAQALSRWPFDTRIEEVRREAAERIVADALGRKYSGDMAGAIHLAKLALELQPTLTTAQHLVAELEGSVPAETAGPRLPQVAPASSEVGATGVEHRPAARRGAQQVRPAAGGRTPASAAPATVPSSRAGAAPPTPAGVTPRPVLPPTTPPLPTVHAPPIPSSTGPWL
jgi:serine/threonine-protein kinase